ncbi:MAG: polysaccharide deacetylase family protein [Candidatus Riflebacteria bacterium]|nr:polysaccharide deacetylase family protein [Candidatus Riflebacteria bacterium]
MKILHLVSHSIMRGKMEVTGSDVYVLTLSDAQSAEGHEVFIAGDFQAGPTNARFVRIPIGRRRPHQRLMNVLLVRKLILRRGIELVHAHSRAASWIARQAVRGTRIPFISTIHGRQKLHLSTRIFDVYGNHIITVCDNLREHLSKELGIDCRRAETIPNAINFARFPARPAWKPSPDGKFVITIIGRTTGEKGNKLCRLFDQVFPALLDAHPKLIIKQVGGSPEHFSAEFRPLWDKFRERYADRIIFTGHRPDLSEELAEAGLVIGGGRVAVEAAHAEVPVFPFGESCRHPRLTPENMSEALKTNFGDILPLREMPPIDYAAFRSELESFISTPTPSDPRLPSLVATRFGVRDVTRRILELYRRMLLQCRYSRQVPVLMYHKIPKAPPQSRHRTWVSADMFERHLRFLRRHGYQSITMRDVKAFIDGTRPLSDFPAKPVMITFDDGYMDNYENAFPLMRRYGFTGLIFCMGDTLLRDNAWDHSPTEASAPLMTIPQIREMCDAGFEIGAHTLSHPHLTEIGAESARREIAESRLKLEEVLGTSILSFAYPYGEYDDRTVELVREAGFYSAFATSTGAADFFDDPFRIFRTHVFPKDGVFQMIKKTSAWYRSYFFFKHGK